MPEQVEREHVEAVGEPFREPGEVLSVARDAVQADHPRRSLLAPRVDARVGLTLLIAPSGPETSSVRRSSSSSSTSTQTTVPSLSIRKVPRKGAPFRSLKTP